MVGLRPEEASSSPSVNSVFAENITKTMVCKKLRAIFYVVFLHFLFLKSMLAAFVDSNLMLWWVFIRSSYA